MKICQGDHEGSQEDVLIGPVGTVKLLKLVPGSLCLSLGQTSYGKEILCEV